MFLFDPQTENVLYYRYPWVKTNVDMFFTTKAIHIYLPNSHLFTIVGENMKRISSVEPYMYRHSKLC